MSEQWMWQSLLDRVSRKFLEHASPNELMLHGYGEDEETHQKLRDINWLGYSPATEAQITATEQRLSVRLPVDYRHFLETTNGWRSFTLFMPPLYPVERLVWLRDSERAYLIQSQLEWHPHQHELEYIPETHLNTAMLIGSDLGPPSEPCLLLNPLRRSARGDWEAWCFNRYDGFERLPSFWFMMLEYVELALAPK
jgi:hypothetical protein